MHIFQLFGKMYLVRRTQQWMDTQFLTHTAVQRMQDLTENRESKILWTPITDCFCWCYFIFCLNVSSTVSRPWLFSGHSGGTCFPCQSVSVGLSVRGLWPVVDKRVAMRQRACWACCTPIISMASHTPPLHQTLFSTTSACFIFNTFCLLLFWQLMRQVIFPKHHTYMAYFSSLLVP